MAKKKPQDQTIAEWYKDYDAATPIVAQPRGRDQKRDNSKIGSISVARMKKQYERGEI